MKTMQFNGKTWTISGHPLPPKPGMVDHYELTCVDTGRRISMPVTKIN
jgi:hypothetical protein